MGNVDLFHSRRINFFKCKYWLRDERARIGTGCEWVLQAQPNGYFRARPITPNRNEMNVLNNVFAFDNNHITIETDDEIDGITRGSVVEFDEKNWLVEAVQTRIHNRQSEFGKRTSYKYILILRKG